MRPSADAKRRLISALLGIVLLLLTGCSATPSSAPTRSTPIAATGPVREAPPAVQHLLRLMRDRLVLMHDVARSKWNAKRPIGDPEREGALLQEMEEKGRDRGLDPQFVREFFAAQIAAARQVQEADFARWRAEEHGPFADVPGLAALRERIDSLNRELLSTLAEARIQLDDTRTREQLREWAQAILTGEGVTDDVRAAAIEPLVGP